MSTETAQFCPPPQPINPSSHHLSIPSPTNKKPHGFRRGSNGPAKVQEWFENGAANSFNVMPPMLPESLNNFVDLVIPELQRRGLFRTAHEGTTLYEKLGLTQPESRYANVKKVA